MPKSVQKDLFPMSLRPQAHDIITFWLFNTVVKSQLHSGKKPWKDVMISGHALDPHGKKMSKSKGNVVEPQEMIGKYSSDSLRYWSAGSKLGDDLSFQEKDLVTGEKFINKLWNASKFCFMHLEDFTDEKVELECVDKWFLGELNTVIKNATSSFDTYEYARTKADVDKFFWQTFCDNYLEIIKDRIYNPDKRGEAGRKSAQYALYHGLLGVLKMMAPIMPHITEEIYHLYYSEREKLDSIHVSSWPLPVKVDDCSALGELIVFVVGEVRKAKSEKQLSMKEPVKVLSIIGKIDVKEFEKIEGDVRSTTGAETVEYEQGEEMKVEVEL
jgi:valyl-tRNA synthetase